MQSSSLRDRTVKSVRWLAPMRVVSEAVGFGVAIALLRPRDARREPALDTADDYRTELEMEQQAA